MINYQALKNFTFMLSQYTEDIRPNKLMVKDQNAPKVKVIRYTSLN